MGHNNIFHVMNHNITETQRGELTELKPHSQYREQALELKSLHRCPVPNTFLCLSLPSVLASFWWLSFMSQKSDLKEVGGHGGEKHNSGGGWDPSVNSASVISKVTAPSSSRFKAETRKNGGVMLANTVPSAQNRKTDPGRLIQESLLCWEGG